MWWKLLLLGLVSLLLVFLVQPIRTHAVKIDLPQNGSLSSQRPALSHIFSAMYVTPTSLAISALIIALAGYVAYRIVRG